jgi:hypothetical protein
MDWFRRALSGGVCLALALTLSAPALAEKAEKPAKERSLMLPPLSKGMTRVYGNVRPFFNMTGPGAGALSDLTLEHYFHLPWKLGVELSPVALVGVPSGLGAIAHSRVRAAFASDYVEVGVGVGWRFQHFGPSGMSLAPALRLGSLDGLNLRLELGYSLIRNYYTGIAQFAWSHARGGIDVPVTRKLALTLEGGYGLDLWVYTTLGARQIIMGDGGKGTLAIGASFGLVWIVDRFPCQYGDVDPCRGAAWGAGPTIAVRVDRRF